jgi:VWFA-related protein
MELIADQTGGRMYAPRASGDLRHVYREIADDLRVQYTLGYHSMHAANDGQWREIEVKIINRPDLAVRARRGYYGKRG